MRLYRHETFRNKRRAVESQPSVFPIFIVNTLELVGDLKEEGFLVHYYPPNTKKTTPSCKEIKNRSC